MKPKQFKVTRVITESLIVEADNEIEAQEIAESMEDFHEDAGIEDCHWHVKRV